MSLLLQKKGYKTHPNPSHSEKAWNRRQEKTDIFIIHHDQNIIWKSSTSSSLCILNAESHVFFVAGSLHVSIYLALLLAYYNFAGCKYHCIIAPIILHGNYRESIRIWECNLLELLLYLLNRVINTMKLCRQISMELFMVYTLYSRCPINHVIRPVEWYKSLTAGWKHLVTSVFMNLKPPQC